MNTNAHFGDEGDLTVEILLPAHIHFRTELVEVVVREQVLDHPSDLRLAAVAADTSKGDPPQLDTHRLVPVFVCRGDQLDHQLVQEAIRPGQVGLRR